MTTEICSVTEIEASAEAVWHVLTDLEAFAVWNPFIASAEGSTEVGDTVRVRVRSSLRVPLGFEARIVTCKQGRELRWRGHVLTEWLACGDHTFTIEPLEGGRVRFEQRETFSGLLPWLARRLLARETQHGFDAMNEALADRVRLEDE
jgi:hypothetical protein